MNHFARSRVVDGGVQIEVDTETAQKLRLICSDGAAELYGDSDIERVRKTIANTLLVDRPDYSKPRMDDDATGHKS